MRRHSLFRRPPTPQQTNERPATHPSSHLPGEELALARVLGAGPRGRPADGVDLLPVLPQVLHARRRLGPPYLGGVTRCMGGQCNVVRSVDRSVGRCVVHVCMYVCMLWTLAVVSSEQEASSVPVGSHATVFTSSSWPCARQRERGGGTRIHTTVSDMLHPPTSHQARKRVSEWVGCNKPLFLTRKVWVGSACARSKSLIVLSAEPVAKDESSRQDRSRMGASCAPTHLCCVCPVLASHTTAA